MESMKDFAERKAVENQTIIEFLKWAEKQPRGENKVILTIVDVPEPR